MRLKKCINRRCSTTIIYATVPLDKLVEYAGEDADVTWQLYEVLKEQLIDKKLLDMAETVEFPLVPTLVAMERHGIRVDDDALASMSHELTQQIAQLEEEITEHAGEEFNLRSPKQLGTILFDKLVVDSKPKKTKTGQYVTDEATLRRLEHRHPIVAAILQFRSLTKLQSTYVDALPQWINSTTHRIHSHFDQAVTATGRLASHDPNLQNIPIRGDRGREVRQAFVPPADEPGWTMLSADYSQVELRLVAAMSGDERMIEAFSREDVDFHSATAGVIYEVDPHLIDSDMRRNAKTVNFSILYGVSAFGLSERLGITRGEAKKLIDSYFYQFAGLNTWMDSTLEFAKDHGYVQTLFGRRRYMPDIDSRNATQRKAAERTAINAPVQGTAADIIKVAMHRIDSAIRERGGALAWYSKCMMSWYSIAHQKIRSVYRLLKIWMTSVVDLPVPLSVEWGLGSDWLAAHYWHC